jgi:two-component system response regulator BaeR
MTKILLVEDDKDIVEMVLLFLREQGYEVLHVDDGALVIESVTTFQPDLVIMDIMLPNKDGYDCTNEIRKVCNVPIIMLTARTAQADVISGLKSGADDYLCKPFDIDELVLRIRALINRTKGHVVFDN